MISHEDFLNAVDDARVIEAIRAAEAKTSCEFRVFVSRHEVDYPVTAAAEQFERLHMHATKLRNAVLIFIAPRSRKFAIYTDRAAHGYVGQALLETLSSQMGSHFKSSRYTDGLVEVLGTLSESLAGAFPSSGDSGNELSDLVERD